MNINCILVKLSMRVSLLLVMNFTLAVQYSIHS